MKKNILIVFMALISAIALVGCGEGEVASNEAELKNYKVPESNNPQVGEVDGANKEFGGGGKKGAGAPGGS
jgi:hypothetical protein